MAALFIFAAWFLLVHQTLAQNNNAPCLPTTNKNGYDNFLQRHIRSDTPSSLDQNEWDNYIKSKNDCDRPTQSFLQSNDLNRVKNVCTSEGGVIHQGNLCISRQSLTFVTVRIDTSTCSIRSVREETKHLILACDELNNQCLPVHFEGNPLNLKPDNKAKACQASSNKVTTASGSRMKVKPHRGSRGRVHREKHKSMMQRKLCMARYVFCCIYPSLHNLPSCHT